MEFAADLHFFSGIRIFFVLIGKIWLENCLGFLPGISFPIAG